jgi:hypothetical protein
VEWGARGVLFIGLAEGCPGDEGRVMDDGMVASMAE